MTAEGLRLQSVDRPPPQTPPPTGSEHDHSGGIQQSLNPWKVEGRRSGPFLPSKEGWWSFGAADQKTSGGRGGGGEAVIGLVAWRVRRATHNRRIEVKQFRSHQGRHVTKWPKASVLRPRMAAAKPNGKAGFDGVVARTRMAPRSLPFSVRCHMLVPDMVKMTQKKGRRWTSWDDVLHQVFLTGAWGANRPGNQPAKGRAKGLNATLRVKKLDRLFCCTPQPES